MHLTRAVYAAYHLHVVVDVAQRLGHHHRALALVAETLRGVKRNTRRGALVQYQHIQLARVELHRHALLILVRALSHYGTSILHAHVAVATSQLAHAVTLGVQLADDVINRAHKHIARALHNQPLHRLIGLLGR